MINVEGLPYQPEEFNYLLYDVREIHSFCRESKELFLKYCVLEAMRLELTQTKDFRFKKKPFHTISHPNLFRAGLTLHSTELLRQISRNGGGFSEQGLTDVLTKIEYQVVKELAAEPNWVDQRSIKRSQYIPVSTSPALASASAQ